MSPFCKPTPPAGPFGIMPAMITPFAVCIPKAWERAGVYVPEALKMTGINYLAVICQPFLMLSPPPAGLLLSFFRFYYTLLLTVGKHKTGE